MQSDIRSLHILSGSNILAPLPRLHSPRSTCQQGGWISTLMTFAQGFITHAFPPQFCGPRLESNSLIYPITPEQKFPSNNPKKSGEKPLPPPHQPFRSVHPQSAITLLLLPCRQHTLKLRRPLHRRYPLHPLRGINLHTRFLPLQHFQIVKTTRSDDCSLQLS